MYSTKVMTETMFLAFLQHFISLPRTPAIQALKDTSSLPLWSATFPCENKAYEEGGSTSDSGSLWPYWPDQQETGWQVPQSLFSPQTLLLSKASLHKGGEHRAIFNRGFSLSIVTRLWKPRHFPRQSASAVLLECIDQMTQRSDSSFPYLPKGLIPCLRRAFFPVVEQGLFLCGTGNFLVPVDHSKQEKGAKLVISCASQSRFQAHFFHHLFIHRPCHCCHQSPPEGTGHATSEEADQPEVLQQKRNKQQSITICL